MTIILRRNSGGRALVPFYRPFGLFQDIDELAREMWDAWRPFTSEQSLVPHTDMYEEKNELVIKAELPGIDRKDIDLTLKDNILTIKADKKEEVVEVKKVEKKVEIEKIQSKSSGRLCTSSRCRIQGEKSRFFWSHFGLQFLFLKKSQRTGGRWNHFNKQQ